VTLADDDTHPTEKCVGRRFDAWSFEVDGLVAVLVYKRVSARVGSGGGSTWT
jgi:hypothetical protein